MKASRCLMVFGAVAVLGGVAGASKDAGAQAKRRDAEVATIGTIVIKARPINPSAVVELGKIIPEIEIATIRQPFLLKIEEALLSEPF
jgi:hypothetical protein